MKFRHTAAGLALALAVVNRVLTKRAERRHPPRGRFLELRGVRLHFVERGDGPAIVFLHGTGSLIQELELSGVPAAAAKKHRIILFDRPGHGHSSRPRLRLWTAAAQARLFHEALDRLDALPAVVVGHSSGASLALTMAQKFPRDVSGLVLISGYYFPTAKPVFAVPLVTAIPVVGDILVHTVLPWIARAGWIQWLYTIFAPAAIPERDLHCPKSLCVRPGQLRAAAAEASYAPWRALLNRRRYKKLKLPMAIVAGAGDHLIRTAIQASALHEQCPGARYHLVRGAGHMVHHIAPEEVMLAIDEVCERARH